MAYRETDPQRSLLECEFLLPEKKRRKLEKSWAAGFRDGVLPLVDESLFRRAFKKGGRPNKSIRLLVGLHLLKEWHDLTDIETIDNLQFNLQWHFALGVTAETADVCQKTMHNFRARMLAHDLAEELFESLTLAMVKEHKVPTALQRLDSTHAISNIAVLTRLGLLVKTVTAFLEALRREGEDHLGRVDGEIQGRYLEREGYFADAKKAEAPRRLRRTAKDMHRLLQTFSAVEEVASLDAFKTLQRVFSEQCEVVKKKVGGGGRKRTAVEIRPRDPKQVGTDSVQSPYDTDATYGRKGKGYEVQIAETCGAEGDSPRLITHVSVNGANESDIHATVPVIDKLDEAGMKPQELLADTAYCSGQNIVEAAHRDVELVGPVQDPRPADDDEAKRHANPPGLAGFAFDTTCHEVLSCTAGHEPVEQRISGPHLIALFAAAHCAACPLSNQCPTRRLKSGDRQLRRAPKSIATEIRQFEQRHADFKERYKLRSGIESVNRELKYRHGLAKPRVRGRPRFNLAIHLKALALNAKRVAEFCQPRPLDGPDTTLAAA